MTMAQRVIRSVRLYSDSPKPSHASFPFATVHDEDAVALLSPRDAENARREAEYLARRNGTKQPLLQVWKV